LESPTPRQVVDNINRRLPKLPEGVRAERGMMTHLMLHHTCAAYESGFASGRRRPRPNWSEASNGLIDVMVAIWQAPITARG
jgi:hypothetical protein